MNRFQRLTFFLFHSTTPKNYKYRNQLFRQQHHYPFKAFLQTTVVAATPITAPTINSMNGDDHNEERNSTVSLLSLTNYLSNRKKSSLSYLQQQFMLGNDNDNNINIQSHRNAHIVIGNEAGDADSIISTIAYAYIHDCMMIPVVGYNTSSSTTTSTSTTSTSSTDSSNSIGNNHYDDNNNSNNDIPFSRQQQQQRLLPIISISDIDLQSQRPETVLLLQLAGITPLHDHLICINQLLKSDNNTPNVTTATNNNNKNPNKVVLNVTLVDHNRFNHDRFQSYIQPDNNNDSVCPMEYNVVTILDHHIDENYHRDTTTSRTIAYENNVALVASTCTLMVELLQQHWMMTTGNNNSDATTTATIGTCQQQQQQQYIPASLSLLLLGVILLDTINMNTNAGKVTSRDMDAIQYLLRYTDWEHDTSLPSDTKQLLLLSSSLHTPNTTSTTNDNDNTIQHRQQPNTTLLFNTLQNAKFASEFWQSLSIRDALRLDYKLFQPSNDLNEDDTKAYKNKSQQQQRPFCFGISTVLMSFQDFSTKPDFDMTKDNNVIDTFMMDMKIDILGIMFAYSEEDNHLNRELVFIGQNASLIDNMIHYLLSTNNNTLQLVDMSPYHPDGRNNVNPSTAQQTSKNNNHPNTTTTTTTLYVRSFKQGNYAASRKQVAPLLLQFFSTKLHETLE